MAGVLCAGVGAGELEYCYDSTTCLSVLRLPGVVGQAWVGLGCAHPHVEDQLIQDGRSRMVSS